jgi:outer membrane protein TolC
MEMNIELPLTIEATMLYGRYDILNAYKELEILNKKTRISYKAMLPQITFSTNITNSKQAIDSLSIEETLWQLIGGVTQPIFNAGQLESIAKTKSIESKISLQNYQKTILKALEELEVNLEEKLSLEKRHKILQDNLKLNQEKVNSSKDGYLRNFKTLDEYLLQKIALLEYQEQLKDFEKAYLTNKIKLALIIGYKFENLLKN